MQEYANVVIDALPLMLNAETKAKGAVKVSSYMSALLREVKTEDDLYLFAKVLDKCKKFASENNLGGLKRMCDEWNREGLFILKQFQDLNNEQSNNNDNNMNVVQGVQQLLSQTREIISKTGMIYVDDYRTASDQLDQLESSLMNTGKQYLTDEQIQAFLAKIADQREHIRINYSMIDDILGSK